MRKRTVITEDVEGFEVELDFEPVGDILSKKIGNKIVVAYLTHDGDPENPMEAMDGEGKLFTKPSRMAMDSSITDDSSWGSYLGLTEDGEPDLELEAVTECAFTKLMGFVASDEYKALFVQYVMQTETTPEELVKDIFPVWADQAYAPEYFGEELSDFVFSLPNYQATCEAAWNELNAEGKIGDYLAVPVSYSSYSQGTSIGVADLDNCNAVWVPGPNEIDNMMFLPAGVDWAHFSAPDFPNGMNVLFKGEIVVSFQNYHDGFQFIRDTYTDPITHADKLRTAEKYAESCLNTYVKWCNGDCFGCVVQIHDAETGEQVGQDACWGFYGSDDAEENLLNEFFNPTVEGIEREQTP